MNKRAIIYARVSTDDQADRGYSLPSQLEACRKYAADHGFSVVFETTEDYTGTVPIGDRPAGRKVAAMLKRQEADVVIVHAVDRLSRDLVYALATVRDWTRAGLEVHALDIGKIDSEADIVLVIKAWQGHDERKKIIERTSRGSRQKALSGKVVGSGIAPYGYRYADGQFIIEEVEAAIVRLIFEWYTLGDGDVKPLSGHAIAKRLSEARIPTPYEKHHRPRLRESGMWGGVSVRRILSNETYAGVWRYGKRIGADGAGGTRPLEQTIAVEVPAIIDQETWKLAKARHDYNVKNSRRNCQNDYLLRGMVECDCKRPMFPFMSHGKHYRYKCSRHALRFTDIEGQTCHESMVDGDRLEAEVWKYAMKVMTDPKKFHDELLKVQAIELGALQPKRERLATIEALMVDCEAEIVELAEALKKAKGKVSKTLEAQQDEVNRRYEAQAAERDKLLEEIKKGALTDDEIAHAMRVRENVYLGMQNPTFEDRRRQLEILRTNVRIEGGKAHVICKMRRKPETIDLRIV
jgi:site-specific DNA recombinase